MKKIEELLEKYFEGRTSLEEEKILREYFLQDDIPEEWEVYRGMFGFFSKEIEENKQNEIPEIVQTKNNSKIWIRWAGIGIAASMLLFFGIKGLLPHPDEVQTQSMVYIDGKAFKDIQLINKETLNALENISDKDNDIISSQIDVLDSFTEN